MVNLFGDERWRVEVIAHGGSKLGGQPSVNRAADDTCISIRVFADIKASVLPSIPKLLAQCYGGNLLAHNGFQARDRQS